VTYWGLALNNLARRPLRTALTISAIAIGIAAIVSLTSIAWGFEASWQRANDARGTDLIVTRLSSENTLPSPFAAAVVQPQLAKLPHVAQVAGLLSELLSVGDAQPMFVFGWEHGSFLWDHLKLREGRWPSDAEEHAVALGALASELVHKRVGDTVAIGSGSFRVTGIYQSAAPVENGALLMTLPQAQRLSDKAGKVNILNIKLDESATEADAAAVRAQVSQSMPGFAAVTSGELVQQNAIVRIAKAMSAATILIAGLVGALGVLNTMLMSVNERTHEIGVLLALGWRRRAIVLLILMESIAVSIAGGAIGIALGVLGVSALEQVALLRSKIEGIFTPGLILSAIALSVVFGIVGGLYPALRAARLSPSVALRDQ
jgi:putative ABC transport system permease protein